MDVGQEGLQSVQMHAFSHSEQGLALFVADWPVVMDNQCLMFGALAYGRPPLLILQQIPLPVDSCICSGNSEWLSSMHKLPELASLELRSTPQLKTAQSLVIEGCICCVPHATSPMPGSIDIP